MSNTTIVISLLSLALTLLNNTNIINGYIKVIISIIIIIFEIIVFIYFCLLK
ncbi:hypothetical protein [Acidianus sp. HS-5]|uniref:hypothetical protein n=1 Tax=Acidianus sp. HS-5 TaxID=2886040 RepID=UPI001F2CCA21|nr:hypothetical protein [Acidianus sp. HS-5]